MLLSPFFTLHQGGASPRSGTTEGPITLEAALNIAMDKKRKWPADAPQTKHRDELLTKVFISTNLTTSWLDHQDVKNFLHAMEEKYDLPGKYKTL